MIGRQRQPIGEPSDIEVTDLKKSPLKHRDGTIARDHGWHARGRVRDRNNRYREVVVIRDTKIDAKREAKRRLDALASQIKAGVVDDRPANVAELAHRWLEARARTAASPTATPEVRPGRKIRQEKGLSPNTLASYATTVETIIVPQFGSMRLDDLTVRMLDDALIDLDTVRSTRIARTALGQILAHGVARGWLTSNPMRSVSPPSRVRSEVEALSVEAARRLLAMARAEVGHIPLNARGQQMGGRRTNRDLVDALYVLLGTGIRIGELIALRWCDVDLEADVPTVLIAGTMIEARGAQVPERYRQAFTKGKESRTIALPDAVAAVLRQRRASARPQAEDAYVFAGSNGEPIWPSNVRTRLRTLTKNDPELQGTSPHTLRRTVGDRLFEVYGLQAVIDVLGHTPGGVSFQHYVRSRRVDPSLRHALDDFFEAADINQVASAPTVPKPLSQEDVDRVKPFTFSNTRLA